MWSVCSRRRLSSQAWRMWQRRQPRRVRPRVAAAVDLGGQHDLLPPAAALGEPAADDLLGLAAAVDVGGVEEVDAGLERRVHDLVAVGLVGLRPEVHRAEAQRADPQAGAAEVAIVHGRNLPTMAGSGTGVHGPAPPRSCHGSARIVGTSVTTSDDGRGPGLRGGPDSPTSTDPRPGDRRRRPAPPAWDDLTDGEALEVRGVAVGGQRVLVLVVLVEDERVRRPWSSG